MEVVTSKAEQKFQEESRKLKQLLKLQEEQDYQQQQQLLQQQQTQIYQQQQENDPFRSSKVVVQQTYEPRQSSQVKYQTLVTPIHNNNSVIQQKSRNSDNNDKVNKIQNKKPSKKSSYQNPKQNIQQQQQYLQPQIQSQQFPVQQQQFQQQQPLQQQQRPVQQQQMNSKNLEGEILQLQDLIKQRKKTNTQKNADGEEQIEIVLNQKNNGEAMKKLVKRNQKLEKDLAFMNAKHDEYLYKYNTLKKSWEEKDDELHRQKHNIERSKNNQNEVVLELERYKMRCQYLEEDLARAKSGNAGPSVDHTRLDLGQFNSNQQQQQGGNHMQQLLSPQSFGSPQQQQIVEKIVEVPVEKIIEKIIDRPIEVEKIIEKIIEVPVEKVIEIIKEVPVNFDNTFERGNLTQQLKNLQRDLEKLELELLGKQQEIDSWSQKCKQLEDYHRYSDNVNQAPREQFEQVNNENESLKKKIELLYQEIKDITFQNDHKNQHLENHIRQLEYILTTHQITFPSVQAQPPQAAVSQASNLKYIQQQQLNASGGIASFNNSLQIQQQQQDSSQQRFYPQQSGSLNQTLSQQQQPSRQYYK